MYSLHIHIGTNSTGGSAWKWAFTHSAHLRRLPQTKAFRLFPKALTCSLSRLQLCPPRGVVRVNVILNICQLNQSSKFSTREHYVDLRCSLENAASINSAHRRQPGGTPVSNFIYDTFNLAVHLWQLCKREIVTIPLQRAFSWGLCILSDHLPVCFLFVCLFSIPRGQFYLSFLKFCSPSWDIFLVQ